MNKYNPKDCWHVPYFLPNGKRNKNCRLSSGCTEKKINAWLRMSEAERFSAFDIAEAKITYKNLLKTL